MGKDEVKTVAEAIHKIQLALLDGIKYENQLFAAGSLLCKSDYNDVVTERSISRQCGYPLCSNALPPEPPKKGHYRLSLKEHKVYDVQETCLYCESKCLISSKAFAGSLQEERCAILNPNKVYGVLRLFDGLGSDEDGKEENENVAKEELVIKDKEKVKGGDVSAKGWMGKSNAIEGYVPQRDRRSKPVKKGSMRSNDKKLIRNEVDFEVGVKPNEKSAGKKAQNRDKSTHLKNSELLEPFLSEINFSSTIISNDEYAVSKENSSSSSNHAHSAAKGASKLKKAGSNKGKDSFLGSMDFMSAIITDDEYSVSKLPSSPVISDPNQMAQKLSELKITQDSIKSDINGSTKAENKSAKFAEDSFHEDVASSSSGYAENVKHSSKATAKSSLRTSGSKRTARSVSWADEKGSGGSSGNLCEFNEVNDKKERHSTLKNKGIEEEDEDSRRFASAEACAVALSQAAEAVATGQSDATDAVSAVGITVLSQHDVVDSEECPIEDEELEERDSVKWPEKPDNLDPSAGDPESSWVDSAPDGFSLELSPFAMMWNALFSWMTSSSLAYIYGKDDSFHDEYTYLNGREYPSKVVLPDGCSTEIKKTLAGCISRALPGLITDLKLPTSLSALEQGLGCLLNTMSFMDGLPPFRMKQWQVIVLLFIDALSICRIPGLTSHLTRRRNLYSKVLSGAKIGAEEFEIMKDIVIPLGYMPQLPMKSDG